MGDQSIISLVGIQHKESNHMQELSGRYPMRTFFSILSLCSSLPISLSQFSLLMAESTEHKMHVSSFIGHNA